MLSAIAVLMAISFAMGSKDSGVGFRSANG